MESRVKREKNPTQADYKAQRKRDRYMAKIKVEPVHRNPYPNLNYGMTLARQRAQLHCRENKSYDCATSTARAAPFLYTLTTSHAPGGSGTAALDYSFGSVNALQQVFCLNNIPVGSGVGARVGKRCRVTAVALRGTISAAATIPFQDVTMALVWDRNPNGPILANALPSPLLVFNTADSASLTNKDNAPRFKVLRRWPFRIIGTTGVVTAESNTTFDEYVTLKNKVTIFNAADTNGLGINMIEGGLFLYCLGTPGSAVSPTLVISARVYFDDC